MPDEEPLPGPDAKIVIHPDAILSVKDVGEALGRSTPSVHRYIRKDLLEAHKGASGHWYVTTEALRNFFGIPPGGALPAVFDHIIARKNPAIEAEIAQRRRYHSWKEFREKAMKGGYYSRLTRRLPKKQKPVKGD